MINHNQIEKPNFFVVGTHRAGTTWLYEVFLTASDIFVTPEKETMFFCSYYDRGIKWYEHFYKSAQSYPARGEINPNYLAYKEVAYRIYKHYPESKIIVVLRNPVDQYISMYRLAKLRKRSVPSINELVMSASELPLQLYHDLLSMYLKLFPEKNILILKYEDMLDNEQHFLDRITEFLGVKHIQYRATSKKVNATRISRFKWLDVSTARIGRFLREYNMYSLKHIIEKMGLVKLLKSINRKAYSVRSEEILSAEAFERIYNLLSDDLKLLAESLKID